MTPQKEQAGESCCRRSEEGDKGVATPTMTEAHPVAFDAPDGGWGWVVLVATIVVLALTLAFPSCMGIFYTDLQTEFHASNSETSWVPSIMTAVLHAGGPLCSVLVERFGCRITVMVGGVLSGMGMAASSFTHSIIGLYITAGVITGLGFCFSFQPAVTILGHYFVRRRAFANAMSSTGTALGLATLPFLGHYLHSELGWRGSFLVLGAVLLNCCVCGAVMRPLVPRLPKRQSKCPAPVPEGGLKARVGVLSKSLATSFRRHMAFDLFCSNHRFCVFSLAITWMMLGFVVPLIFLVPYATDHGMDQSEAALLLSIMGFTNIFVRPPVGLLFGLPWFKGRHIYVISVAVLLNGLSDSICCIAPSFSVLLIYVLCYGLSMSVVGSLVFTVLMDIVDMRRFPAALGLLSIMESVTLLIGPPLAGSLVDRTGEYTYLFLACSITVASSALFLLVSFYWLDRREAAKKVVLPTLDTQDVSEHNLVPKYQYIRVSVDGKDDRSFTAMERVTSV
ncbi:monocarboxylate transporter 6 [Electrophorus electricus]|uniref:Major facilitator superfamily (MFS) profile domain-containing protein n=1 Tax=Electrophorus electricus TaxID=8005 RepID=A0A4W4F0I4_ELEEL|nr:monocarboxylate transporter 6 [Electrophorus electricus]